MLYTSWKLFQGFWRGPGCRRKTAAKHVRRASPQTRSKLGRDIDPFLGTEVGVRPKSGEEGREVP